jgi:FkbM family methyltransferase
MGHPLFVRPHTSYIAVVQELLWEKAYLPVVQRSPRPVKAILDLGGNVGYSVRFWQKQFPDAEIVVVEPDPKNYRQLRKNIEIGGHAQWVQTIHALVGAKPGEAFLDRSANCESMLRMSEAEARGSIRIVKKTVPDLLKLFSHGNGRVDVLKCDIEGTEVELFADCRSWIDRIGYLTDELHSPYNAAEFQEHLRAAGVRMEKPWISAKPGCAALACSRIRPQSP